MFHRPHGIASGFRCKRTAHQCSDFRCQRATPFRKRDLSIRGGQVQRKGTRSVVTHCREMAGERPTVAPDDRAGERPCDTQRSRVGQRLLGKVTVDRQRTALVQPGNGTELGNGVEQGDETTSSKDRRGVVRRFRSRCQANRRRTDRIGHPGQE